MITRLAQRARDDRGFTLAEVLLATVILLTATGATFAAMRGVKRAGLGAQRSQEQTRIAQSALEQLKSMRYSELGMSANMNMNATNPAQFPTGESSRFNSSTNRPDTMKIKVLRQSWLDQWSYTEDIVQPWNGGTTSDGTNTGPAGKVSPVPEDLIVAGSSGTGSKFRIYKWVTWHNEPCFGTGTLDRCGGTGTNRTHDVKRVVVAVEPRTLDGGTYDPGDADPNPRQTYWTSEFVPDPGSGSDPNVCAGGPCTTASSGAWSTQKFFLTDTQCDSNASQPQHRVEPGASHSLHLTSAAGPGGWTNYKDQSVCKNNTPPASNYLPGNNCWPQTGVDAGKKMCRPDLMWTDPPSLSGADCDDYGNNCYDPPAYRYATDLFAANSGPTVTNWGVGATGIPIRRSTGCQGALSPVNPPSMSAATTNGSMVHTWASNAFAPSYFKGSGQGGFFVSGRVSVRLYVGTFGIAPTNALGTICVTLIDKDEASGTNTPVADKVLFTFACQINQWPRGYRGPAASTPTADYRRGQPFNFRRTCDFVAKKGGPTVSPPSAANPNGPGSIDWDPAVGYTVPNGHRLYFRLSVCGSSCTVGANSYSSSNNDLNFYYDYPNEGSYIEVATKPDSQIKDGW